MKIQWVTPYQNNRVKYVASFISDRWGLDFEPVTDLDDSKPYILYGDRPGEHHIRIHASGYLKEGAVPKSIEEKSGRLLINGVDDYFGALFFLLTSAESFTLKKRDEHGRFLVKYSKLPSEFYMTPYVDVVLDRLKNELISNFDLSASTFKNHQFSIQPTFDIDVAFAYGYRPFWRAWGGKMKDRIKGFNDRIEERKKVLKGQLKDPFDTYDTIIEMAEKFDVKVFFLVGKYGKYDKNLSPNSEVMKGLIRKMHQFVDVGIHPSYSAEDIVQMKEEKNALEHIIGQQVQHSRQHFLKIELPDTYRKLVEVGIEHDFTMGFADHPGFRAGTCFPYTFYDIEKETTLPMTVHPFAYMDGTLNEYMHLSPEKAIELVKDLKSEVKKVNGVFSFLWHNDTINEKGLWKGWSEVLKESLSE